MLVFSSLTCPDHAGTFPQRSRPRLLTDAACGGLGSPPARRAQRANLHHWHSTLHGADLLHRLHSAFRTHASCQRPTRGPRWWPGKVFTPLGCFLGSLVGVLLVVGEVAVSASGGLAGRVLGGACSSAAVGGLAAGWVAEASRGADFGGVVDAFDVGGDEALTHGAGEPVSVGRVRSVTHWVWVWSGLWLRACGSCRLG